MDKLTPVGRFAPTPSGRMHLGNVFAALIAWLSVRSKNGEMVLRMEDLDTQRTSAEFAEILRSDLAWLGLDYDREQFPQSQRSAVYDRYFDLLKEKGLLYPCYCTRSQLHGVNAPHLSDGTYVSQPQTGEQEYAGVGQVLERALVSTIGGKIRSVVLNVLQRCSGHLLSGTDIAEARKIGETAVHTALAGETGKIQVFERVSDMPYIAEIKAVPVEDMIAGGIKTFPLEWISEENNDLTQAALDYLLPLIEGEVHCPVKMGLPVHFRFDLTPAKAPEAE